MMAQYFGEESLKKPVIGEESQKYTGRWNFDQTITENQLLCSPIELLKNAFIQAVSQAYPEISSSIVTVRVSNQTFCDSDYQCDAAIPIYQQLKARRHGITLQDVVENILNEFSAHDVVEKTEIFGMGFINVWLKKSFVCDQITSLFLHDCALPPPKKRLRVVVDFSSPKVYKEYMKIGHLRSTIIGVSICNLLEYFGHDVLRFDHVDDWDVEFGLLIAHFEDMYPNYPTEPVFIKNWPKFYAESKNRFRKNTVFQNRAKKCAFHLWNEYPDYIFAWKILSNASRRELRNIYDRLDIKLVERGESFYQKRLQDLVEDLMKKNFLADYRQKKVFAIANEIKLGKTAFPIVDKHGRLTNFALNLCALKQRIVEEKADRIICVINEGESALLKCSMDRIRKKKSQRKKPVGEYGFKNLETSSNSSTVSEELKMRFENSISICAQKCGFYDPRKLRVDFIGCACVVGEKRKPIDRYRLGDCITVAELLDAGVRHWRNKLIKKNRLSVMSGEELSEIAEVIAYSCIKYDLVSHKRDDDYVLSFGKMFEEESNPVIYSIKTYVRIKFITRGQKLNDIKKVCRDRGVSFTHEKEWKLTKVLLQFHDVLRRITQDLCIHRLCHFLQYVAVSFSDFYDCYRVNTNVEGNSTEHHATCVILCEVTASVMKKCFDILGIKV